ncbi:MAG: XrtA/PEP-CTERM system histidine kinase PrsK [Nitrospiria bacterium]
MNFWWSVLPAASAVYAAALAVVVCARKPGDRIHQSFGLGMLAFAVMEGGHFMAALHPESGRFWAQIALAGQILQPLPWLAFSVTFGRADPVEHLRRWRGGLAAVAAATVVFLGLIGAGRFVTEDLMFQRAGLWFSVFLLLTFTLVLTNFERTVRSADRSQRWRMKYFLLGMCSIIAFMIFWISQAIMFSTPQAWVSPVFSTVMLIGSALMTFALVRYRLFDIDVFLSRYVVYHSVTVLFVGASLVGVALATQAVKAFGGDAGTYWSALIVVISLIGLAAVLLSEDVRRRAKRFINRHFFSYKYDYRKEWVDLTERLSSRPTVEAIVPALTSMMYDTFWIRDVRLWLAEEGERDLSPIGPGETPPIRWDPAVVAVLRSRDYPALPDAPPRHPQTLALDAAAREALAAHGIRIVVPLVIQDRLIGILGLSAPSGDGSLNEEDFDLMKTVGKQAAASLMNAQLLRRLVSAKEMETFHGLSTFLLHDLKNFVSMLSLLVANMDRNFDNPAFREDALKSLAQTVDKMKRLMERLRALAQPSAPAFEPVDLSQLGRAVLAELGSTLKASVVGEWGDVPPIRADAAQLRQVLINLVLNAEEAVEGRGDIRVSTRVEDGIVTCAVSDTGCGISPEFLQTRLFKPFATTKSGGFGIGLFQCKTIIEAHGGRVAAESGVGKGSTLSFAIPALTESA